MRFYDLAVIGRSIGALAAAALLSRRGFRVLVVGDGGRPAQYSFDGLPLRRRRAVPLPVSTPVFRRLLAELAQQRPFVRRLVVNDPPQQVFDPHGRLEFPLDPQQRARALERALPLRRSAIETWIEASVAAQSSLDAALSSDAVWPPGTFWERRETARALAAWRRAPLATSPLADGRAAAAVSAMCAARSDVVAGPDAARDPAILARLFGTWMRDGATLAGDEDAFVEWLLERVRELGADVRLGARCEGLVATRGRVSAVQLDTDEISENSRAGCAFVVSSRPGHRLVDAFLEGAPTNARFGGARTDRALVGARRFVVSLIVRRALAPAPLARHVSIEVAPGDGLSVQLQRASFDETRDADALAALRAHDAELWVAEVTAAGEWKFSADSLREAVVRTLSRAFPFLERHALVVDSPHDGAPLWDLRSGARVLVRRADLRGGGATIEREDPLPIWLPRADAYGGFCGEPIRVEGLRSDANVLTVATSVVPALGLEGELLAAWAAARIVTKSDPRREQMRREMWARIEF